MGIQLYKSKLYMRTQQLQKITLVLSLLKWPQKGKGLEY